MSKIDRFAEIVLIGAGGVCILLFTGSVIRHGWAVQYVGLIILAVLLFASLQLGVSSKINAALLLISMAIGLYGAEMVIGQVLLSSSRFHISDWLNFPEDANSKVAVQRIKEEKSANAFFDSRTRLEVVHDLRSQGIRAFPDIFPAVLFQSNGRQVIKSLFIVHDEEFLPLASIGQAVSSWDRIPDLASQNREAILSIVNQLRIPIIDLHGRFASHPDPLSLFPSRRYAHYNVDGHRLVGSETVTRLTINGGPIASTHASRAFTSQSR